MEKNDIEMGGDTIGDDFDGLCGCRSCLRLVTQLVSPKPVRDNVTPAFLFCLCLLKSRSRIVVGRRHRHEIECNDENLQGGRMRCASLSSARRKRAQMLVLDFAHKVP